jgi:hypothetical protein
VAVIPSNSTGVNGDPGGGGGSTGCTCAAIFTLTVRCRAFSWASITSTTHSGSPLSLSACWTGRSAVDRPKSRTISIAPAAYAPSGNTAPNCTGM